MIYPSSGELLSIKCNECVFPEFPNLLFGTTIDHGRYFNASHFISTNKIDNISVLNFQRECSSMITTILESYQISPEKAFFYNNEGHIIIDGALCYLFLMYADSKFLVWTSERINELMLGGISISDSTLLSLVGNRFPIELLQHIINQRE